MSAATAPPAPKHVLVAVQQWGAAAAGEPARILCDDLELPEVLKLIEGRFRSDVAHLRDAKTGALILSMADVVNNDSLLAFQSPAPSFNRTQWVPAAAVSEVQTLSLAGLSDFEMLRVLSVTDASAELLARFCGAAPSLRGKLYSLRLGAAALPPSVDTSYGGLGGALATELPADADGSATPEVASASAVALSVEPQTAPPSHLNVGGGTTAPGHARQPPAPSLRAARRSAAFDTLSCFPPHRNIQRVWAVLREPAGAGRTVGCSLESLPPPLAAALSYDGGDVALQVCVEEYLPSSLDAACALAGGVPLPFPSLFGYSLDLLRGLAHCDAHRVVHCDVSPRTIRVGPDGRLVLCAFERAVTCRSDLMAAHVAGTALPGAAAAAAAGGGRDISEFAASFPPDGGAFWPPEVHVALLQQQRQAASASAASQGRGRVLALGKVDVWAAGAVLLRAALGGPGAQAFPGYPGSLQLCLSDAMAASSSSAAAAGAGAGPTTVPASVLPWACASPSAYPPAFCEVLQAMLRPLPQLRITAAGALSRLEALAAGRPRSALLPLPDSLLEAVLVEVPAPATEGAASSSAAGAPRRVAAASRLELCARLRAGEGDPSAPWVILGVRSVHGAVAAVPVQLPSSSSPGPAAAPSTSSSPLSYSAASPTVDTVACAALELLRLTRPPPAYSLLVGGEKADPGAPLAALLDRGALSGGVLALQQPPGAAPLGLAAPWSQVPPLLVLAAGVAHMFPTVTVPGFGLLAPPPAAPSIPAAPTGTGAATGQSAAAAAAPSRARSTASSSAGGADAAQADALPTSAAGAGGSAGSGGGSGSTPGERLVAEPVATRGGRSLLYAFSERERGPGTALAEANTVVSATGRWATVGVAHPTGISTATWAGKYQFSVKVLAVDPGGGVAIGFVDPARFDFRSSALGAAEGSWAYSKTGKAATGAAPAEWVEYGEPYGVGDIITAEIHPPSGRIKFLKNGVAQGTAFFEADLGDRVLKPAVCLGSSTAGRTARVQLVTPEVREFDPGKAHHRILFSDDATGVYNSGKWASALVAHPGISNGKMSWSIRLDDTKHGAGVAVGVVDVTRFDWEKQNLGASQNSWCWSKTGKKGDGSGFQEYGKTFTSGDIVSVTLDLDAVTLSFAVNGDDQGVAYSAASGLGNCAALVPAVCLGSTEGNKMARVSLVTPYGGGRRFDRFACSPKVKLGEGFTLVETRDKWGTVFVDHPGVSAGRFSFGVAVTSAGTGCGAGVGFADKALFKPASRNLGAADASWCFSKTGKKSAGLGGFEVYAPPYKTGDVITAELDFEAETIKFYVNGKDCGVAFAGGLADRTLVPAVVLGSGDGGHLTQLTLVPPAVTRMDVRRSNKHVSFSNADRTVHTDARWCSALADHPGCSSGILRFAVKLEGEGGAAVGFAESGAFRPYAQNLGASGFTWALSKTGKVSCGDADAFRAFTEKLSIGDVVGCEADMTEGIIRFWRNGQHLGAAFSGLAGKGYNLVPAVCIGSNVGGKMSAVTLVEFEAAWAGAA